MALLVLQPVQTHCCFLGLIVSVSICCLTTGLPAMISRKYTVTCFFSHLEKAKYQLLSLDTVTYDCIPTRERKFPPHFFIPGVSGQISMLSCSTSSISISTRQTTSSSLPPPLHTLSALVSKQDECLSLSHCRALIFDFKHRPLLSFLACFKGVQD